MDLIFLCVYVHDCMRPYATSGFISKVRHASATVDSGFLSPGFSSVPVVRTVLILQREEKKKESSITQFFMPILIVSPSYTIYICIF